MGAAALEVNAAQPRWSTRRTDLPSCLRIININLGVIMMSSHEVSIFQYRFSALLVLQLIYIAHFTELTENFIVIPLKQEASFNQLRINDRLLIRNVVLWETLWSAAIRYYICSMIRSLFKVVLISNKCRDERASQAMNVGFWLSSRSSCSQKHSGTFVSTSTVKASTRHGLSTGKSPSGFESFQSPRSSVPRYS